MRRQPKTVWASMDAPYLIDAPERFAQELNQMMSEMGMDGSTYTPKELHFIVGSCFDEHPDMYAEFMAWVEHGDDQRAKTLDVLRASLEIGRMWR